MDLFLRIRKRETKDLVPTSTNTYVNKLYQVKCLDFGLFGILKLAFETIMGKSKWKNGYLTGKTYRWSQ